MKKKLNKVEIAIIIIIIVIILVDQISKIIMQNSGNINIEEDTNGTDGSNSIMMNIVTNIVIIVIVIKFMLSQNQFVDNKVKIFLSLIIAGGISNILDRIFRGYVLEWIKFLNWLPRLNIADIFVLIGWILVVGNFAYFTAEEWKARKRNKVELEEKNKKEG